MQINADSIRQLCDQLPHGSQKKIALKLKLNRCTVNNVLNGRNIEGEQARKIINEAIKIAVSAKARDNALSKDLESVLK